MGNSSLYILKDTRKNIKILKENGAVQYLFQVAEIDSAIRFSTKPVLRYPGGKTRAVGIILALLPRTIKTLCSPFLGGGSVELACTSRGIRVFGYDIFDPLVEFWDCLLQRAEILADEVQKYYPLTREKFYELQKTQQSLKTKIERAAVFYVLNRSSYSGSTLSGGMSPGHPRFTISSIDRIRSFSNKLISVERSDFKISIPKHKDEFLYLDPPYWIKNHLYGTNGDAHKNFDHYGLFEILRERDKWLLSYNNCPEILKLYRDYKILFPKWKYGMSIDKKSKEVLILSKDIQEELKIL